MWIDLSPVELGDEHELAMPRSLGQIAARLWATSSRADSILEARAVFRCGDHIFAYELLRRFVDDELHASNLSGARIEFINMAITTRRMEHAALLAGYLD